MSPGWRRDPDKHQQESRAWPTRLLVERTEGFDRVSLQCDVQMSWSFY
jgi:hypothetical protein